MVVTVAVHSNTILSSL